jgi:alpha-L-fucosidase
VKLARELQPHIVLNDRLDLPPESDGWDFRTPEQVQPRRGLTLDGRPVVWEACHTFSGSWGYHRDEATWKSTEQLVQLLIDSVSKGGNLLLNVGPTGRGEFDPRALDRLDGIGEWMRRHSRSIYGCGHPPPEFRRPRDCRLTYNPETRRIYVHAFSWPVQHLHLDGFAGRVEYAQLLNDASEVPFTSADAEEGNRTVTLTLPARKPEVVVPVVELFLK